MTDTDNTLPTPADADQLAADLTSRCLTVLQTLARFADFNPFTSPEDLLVLQVLGPACVKLVGQDPSESVPQIVQLVEAMDLSGFVSMRENEGV